MIKELGLKKVINASGKMTILGGSTVDKEITSVMEEALNIYVEMDDLQNKSGEYIANILKCEAAYITSSASAGIALTVASLIAKDNLSAIENIFKHSKKNPNKVIIQKGHSVNYGAPIQTMVNLGGGEVVEVGYSNECKKEHIETMIDEDTIALLYVKSHHAVQKNMVSLEEMSEIARRYEIPLIIDAAAEEDLRLYPKLGDIVVYSGTKAIEGPTSGLVVGKEKYIKNIRLQNKGIGRAFKIGRENILAITKALDIYLNKKKNNKIEIKDLEEFLEKVKKIKGVTGKISKDSSGREIYRVELDFGIGRCEKIKDKLKDGEIAIYTRDYLCNLGKLEIDPRPLKYGDLDIICNRIESIIKEIGE